MTVVRYSVGYFERIAMYKVLYHWTSAKGGAHTCIVDTADIYVSASAWAPPFMEV